MCRDCLSAIVTLDGVQLRWFPESGIVDLSSFFTLGGIFLDKSGNSRTATPGSVNWTFNQESAVVNFFRLAALIPFGSVCVRQKLSCSVRFIPHID